MIERELTGQRDGQAWKSHQINDEKFSGDKSRSWGTMSHGACKRVTTECTVHGKANVSASKYAVAHFVYQGCSGWLQMSLITGRKMNIRETQRHVCRAILVYVYTSVGN